LTFEVGQRSADADCDKDSICGLGRGTALEHLGENFELP
jgi:hypothetical protein